MVLTTLAVQLRGSSGKRADDNEHHDTLKIEEWCTSVRRDGTTAQSQKLALDATDFWVHIDSFQIDLRQNG